MLKYDIYEEMYEILKNSVSKTERSKYYQINEEFDYENIEILIERILTHLKTKSKEISRITTIKENTINHFNKIKLLNCTNEEIELFKDKVENVKNHSDIDLNELISQYKSGKISQEEFLNKTKSTKSDEKFKDIEIVNMPNNYYRPLLYSEVEKIDYAKNIIQNESEVKFIKALIKHVGENKNENWVFSKIEENVDNIYIPYYSATENKYRNFYPDFVFWIKENENYRVVFIDPKGTSHADYQNKIDGYNKLFVKENKPIVFNYGEYKVTFDLKLVTDDVNKVGKLYKKYWLNVNDFSWLI